MDIQELEELVRHPQESAKLDFKLLSYKLFEPQPTKPIDPSKQKIWKEQRDKWEDDRIRQWGELVKDIISLTNGNIGTVNQTAHLIIGADDKLKPDGTPNILDVGDQTPPRKDIYEKVNSYCQPRLPDLHCNIYQFESKRLLVISVPPSPYLHKLSKQLKTPKKDFSPYTVLIRRGDGEEIYEASREEQEAIEKEKQAFSQILPKVAKYENIRLGGVEEFEFFGREQDIEKLRHLFENRDRLTIASITGMGGVGKTELAIQYARRHFQHLGHNSGGVCWIDAREENVGIQLVRFAETSLNIKPQESWDLKTQLHFCWQNWGVGDWLFVIDDVGHYKEQVKPYLPPDSFGFKVLLTTREGIGRPVKELPIRELQPEAANELLKSFINLERIEQELGLIEEICEWMGYLPLGLELVGRYLSLDPGLPLKEVLCSLRQKGLGYKPLVNVDNYAITAERGVAAAFELSWERLDKNAQVLGCLLSLFSPTDIPWSLVRFVYKESNFTENDFLEQDFYENSKVDLIRYSLLRHTGQQKYYLEGLHQVESNSEIQFSSVGDSLYSLHQLIWRFFQKKQDKVLSDDLKRNFVNSILTIAKHLPSRSEIQYQKALSPIFPHVLKLSQDQKLEILMNNENKATLSQSISNFYLNQNLYNEAEAWQSKNLSILLDLHEETHPDVIKSLNNLAFLYFERGEYSKAEELYSKNLELLELLADQGEIKQLENLEALMYSLSNLGMIYYQKGILDKAEEKYIQAFELSQKIFKDKHLQIALIVNNLAMVYHDKNFFYEAETLYLKSLEIRKELLGEYHSDVATSFNNLADLYSAKRQFNKAEPLYLQSLHLYKNCLGNKHPRVAGTLSNLGYMYQLQKRYEEAEVFLLEAIEIEKLIYGDTHLNVAISLGNLAIVYYQQRKFQDAEPLIKQALKINQIRLGNSHPRTVDCRESLERIRAVTMNKLGRPRTKAKKKGRGFGNHQNSP
ncbi:hypothetical protein C7B76_02550 [filamentous cyanobacterium CCP2]|nr:hypothetical protein C7B76_02550 [filamentous cyanobacterium CCP2]